MRFISTRGHAPAVTIDKALLAGLAPDGGLYVPERLARRPTGPALSADRLASLARSVLDPYFRGSMLHADLPRIAQEAFSFDCPVNEVDEDRRLWALETWHGPTAAFKDFGARFLAGCMARMVDPGGVPVTILVATSGDTGAAVAAAFHRRPGIRVAVLYPDGRVSERQAHQLGAFGDNVLTLRVQGDFDACQQMVKALLGDADTAASLRLSSANSISIGRLLPQLCYYAHAVLRITDCSSAADVVDVVVPTGNLGNALACVLAREMGFAIGRIYLATNANRTLPDFFAGENYRARPTTATLANAMDVGDPSNFERLAWLYRRSSPRDADIEARSFDDETIRQAIRDMHRRYGRIVCPHSACAWWYAKELTDAGHDRPLLVVETAHPAKFDSVVEALVGEAVPVPPALAELLGRPSHAESLPADAGRLRERLRQWEA